MSRSDVLRTLARHICTLDRPHPLRVAIDGVAGAGKTMLADQLVELCEAYGRAVIRASGDGFHRPRAQRYARGRYSPEGYYHDTTDYPALIQRLLEPLGPGGSREYSTRSFDWREDRPIDEGVELAGETDVLLLDGLFLLRPELVPIWDYAVYLDVDFETSWRRGLARALADGGFDEEEARKLETSRYAPGHELYLDLARPLEVADAVVDNVDLDAPQAVFREQGRV